MSDQIESISDNPFADISKSQGSGEVVNGVPKNAIDMRTEAQEPGIVQRVLADTAVEILTPSMHYVRHNYEGEDKTKLEGDAFLADGMSALSAGFLIGFGERIISANITPDLYMSTMLLFISASLAGRALGGRIGEALVLEKRKRRNATASKNQSKKLHDE